MTAPDHPGTGFHLLAVYHTVYRRRLPILLLCLLSVVVAAAALLFVPRSYRSATVVVPANPLLTDKAHIFNPHIQQLYSSFGTADDLDRLYGIATLDTTFLYLVDSFYLVEYYHFTQKKPAVARQKAAKALRSDVEVRRTDLNQLLIEVWHTDAETAAEIASTMVDYINRQLQQASYQQQNMLMQQLQSAARQTRQQLMQRDTAVPTAAPQSFADQLQAYNTAIYQLQININAAAPALLVVQPAIIPATPERPRPVWVLLSAALLSLAFGVVAAVVIDRKHPGNATPVV